MSDSLWILCVDPTMLSQINYLHELITTDCCFFSFTRSLSHLPPSSPGRWSCALLERPHQNWSPKGHINCLRLALGDSSSPIKHLSPFQIISFTLACCTLQLEIIRRGLMNEHLITRHLELKH